MNKMINDNLIKEVVNTRLRFTEKFLKLVSCCRTTILYEKFKRQC